VSVQATAQQTVSPQIGTTNVFMGSVTGTLAVPIYQGGQEYSLIRQSKETLGQQRLTLDLVRDQTRQSVVQAWGQLQAAKAQVLSAQSQVTSSEVALDGVPEEAPRRPAHHARRGQRAGPGQFASPWSPHSTIGGSRPTTCWRRPDNCRRAFSA